MSIMLNRCHASFFSAMHIYMFIYACILLFLSVFLSAACTLFRSLSLSRSFGRSAAPTPPCRHKQTHARMIPKRGRCEPGIICRASLLQSAKRAVRAQHLSDVSRLPPLEASVGGKEAFLIGLQTLWPTYRALIFCWISSGGVCLSFSRVDDKLTHSPLG